MAFALRVFVAGLPLLPLMVRCVPAPRDRSSSVFPRAQGDPSSSSSITGTLSPALEAATPFDHPATGIVVLSDPAADSDAYDCACSADEAEGRAFLAGTAGSGAPDADPRARLPTILFLPPDTPPPSPNLSPTSTAPSTSNTTAENPNPSPPPSSPLPSTPARLVARAHQAGKNVKLSVGGWTGSRYFSSAAASPEGRTLLANNILAFYQQFNLDGIDIDWEYPAQDGNAGNLVRPDDSANFLAFLQVLRATLPPGAKITAATQTVPFAGPDGDPMGDVSEFAKVLDWVLLMNYDTWGSSDAPGPNAPLSDACNNSTQGSASALAALRAWTAAGFPASQLVLGVPSYGYISRSSASLLRTRGMPPRRRGRPGRKRRAARRKRDSGTPHHLLDLLEAVVDNAKSKLLPPGQTLVTNEDGGTDDGQVQFRELVQQGVLQPYYLSTSNASSSATAPASSTNNGDDARPRPPRPDVARSDAVRVSVESAEPRALFAGTSGFARGWDLCSSTPFLHSDAARQVVAYDDPVSLEMKAQLAREAGMRGVNMFDVHGDTDDWDLADALLRGLGVR
ncbi:glycoside hydrolase family 18 protein [Trametes sanguinea]|nr:glycoside hydrolase family 18 protein [Trametes sanguinea]